LLLLAALLNPVAHCLIQWRDCVAYFVIEML